MNHRSRKTLDEGITHIQGSPKTTGIVELIVRRPDTGEREVLDVGELHLEDGLVGDNWKTRGSSKTDDGSAHPEMQLNLMNARTIDLMTDSKEDWPLAGDQFFVDLDLSVENLPPGTRLDIGSAVIEITPIPHNGCKKFTQRFGMDAVKFVNSPDGKSMRLRGVNAKVVQPGEVRPGDSITKRA